jgi:hypothetical protein
MRLEVSFRLASAIRHPHDDRAPLATGIRTDLCFAHIIEEIDVVDERHVSARFRQSAQFEQVFPAAFRWPRNGYPRAPLASEHASQPPLRRLRGSSPEERALTRTRRSVGQTRRANGARDCMSDECTFSAINSRVPGNHMVHEQANPVRHFLAEVHAVKRQCTDGIVIKQ